MQISIILVRILSTASPFPPRVLKQTLKVAIYPQRDSTIFCFSSLMIQVRFHQTAESIKNSSCQKPSTLFNMILCLIYGPLWTNSIYESVKYKLFTTLYSTLDRLCKAMEVILRKWATRPVIYSHQSSADSHETLLCLEFCISWECCKPDDCIGIWCSRHSSCINLFTIAPLSQKRVITAKGCQR